MPIPFREADGVDDLGVAGFLKIDLCAVGSTYVGALLLINARGEPVEFTYSRVEVPHVALWRPSDARRFAVRKLVVSLLSMCPKVPHMLLCLVEDVERDLFSRYVQLSLPVCLVTRAAGGEAPDAYEGSDPLPTAHATDLFWLPGLPAEDSSAVRLLQELTIRNFVIEPFSRASRGLREVYAPVASVETK